MAVALVMTGVALLALDFAGLIVEPDPGQSRDTDALRAMLNAPIDDFDLVAVNEEVFTSLRHRDDRRILVYENGLLWLAGHLYEPLSRTQRSDRIIAGGGGLCFKVSQVLNDIARNASHEARFIGLNGHVVSEVLTTGGWRVADADFGVTYDVDLATLEGRSGPGIMEAALTARGLDTRTIENYISFFVSSEDNVVMPVGVPLSPRLYRAEVIADWLRWVVPLAMAGLGVALWRKRAR